MGVVCNVEVSVMLNKLVFPGISFLRIICNVITFTSIKIFFLPFNHETLLSPMA